MTQAADFVYISFISHFYIFLRNHEKLDPYTGRQEIGAIMNGLSKSFSITLFPELIMYYIFGNIP